MVGQRIFIVENNLPLRRSLAVALRQEEDFHVVSTTGRVSDALIGSGVPSPQVIVLDDSATNGILKDEIRALMTRYPNVRIVILTSEHADIMWRKLDSSGVWAVLRKPFTLDDLFATIREQPEITETIARRL